MKQGKNMRSRGNPPCPPQQPETNEVGALWPWPYMRVRGYGRVATRDHLWRWPCSAARAAGTLAHGRFEGDRRVSSRCCGLALLGYPRTGSDRPVGVPPLFLPGSPLTGPHF